MKFKAARLGYSGVFVEGCIACTADRFRLTAVAVADYSSYASVLVFQSGCVASTLRQKGNMPRSVLSCSTKWCASAMAA